MYELDVTFSTIQRDILCLTYVNLQINFIYHLRKEIRNWLNGY